MRDRFFRYALAFVALLSTFSAVAVFAQSGSTRPRRVDPATNQTPPPPSATQPRPAATSASFGDTTRAFALLQQKQYAEAAKEAHAAAAADPKNSEAWKIAGFAEFYQNQFKEAATDLQRALDLQRAAKEEDAPTVDALAQSLVRSDDFERALPLLVLATSRAGATPDATLLYYRGLAEYRTNKQADAERSFNAAVKADPKNSASLFYLGRLAYERNQTDAAIAALNRATLADTRFAEAWTLLTYAYLRRAASATVPAKADADYLNAVRASDALERVRARKSERARLDALPARRRLLARQKLPQSHCHLRARRRQDCGRREHLSRTRLRLRSLQAIRQSPRRLSKRRRTRARRRRLQRVHHARHPVC
jgi:tetratricopeptide (TPR) repeat protein